MQSKQSKNTITAATLALLILCLTPPLAASQIIVTTTRDPIVVDIPSTYDPTRPYPLILNLHGYTLTGQEQENYFQLTALAESEEFLYAYPQGLSDLIGNPFWNGTDACCDLFGNGVDDSSYLIDLVDEIRSRLNVDPWRVHFTGWSNGGFMSYRMACDHADAVASLASLAGATFLDAGDCQPENPVHTLEIHGTSDGTIFYGGGATNIGTYPGAVQTVQTWVGYNGCDATPDTTSPNRDIDGGIAGAETEVSVYEKGCVPGGSARLWEIPGGPHGPALTGDFRAGVVEFLLTHPRAGLRFDDKQTLVWPGVRWAQQYRIYRGVLGDLVDTDADGLADPGYGECASGNDPDPTDTTMIDAQTPAPGSGYFYVVGFVDGDGAASMLGAATSGLPRSPAAVCP